MTHIHEGSLLWEMGDEERGQNAGWPERYRPQNLDQMALDPLVRRQIEAYLRSEFLMHHLIFHGPPATGKTTLANIIAWKFFPHAHHDHVIRVSGSETRSVEYVRDTVMPWVRARGGLWRVLGADWHGMALFSEADGLTPEAQATLKDAMETYAATTAFVFTTNSLDKLDRAIRSRCQTIEMRVPPFEERLRILSAVLESERIEADPFVAVEFAEAYEDMRELLRAAQDSIAIHGELRMPDGTARRPETLWPIPIEGAEMLDAIAAAFTRYLSLPEGGATALALWAVFAHAHGASGHSPILAAVSPVKRSGKTLLFEVLSQLTPRAIFTSNITPACIFRLGGVVDEEQTDGNQVVTPPAFTLLADEGDTWLKLRPEIQGVLNSGHTRRAAYIIRVVGNEPKRFSTFFPKALALINRSTTELPTTVLDRSIVIPMQRRRRDEILARLRFDHENDELSALRKQGARWAHDNFGQLRDANPITPDCIGDRAADNWRPLLAIAEAAGARWAERAHAACLILSGVVDETGELTVVLLNDIRDIFLSDRERPDRLPTSELVVSLRSISDHAWATLTPYRLSLFLRPFGIRPRALWATSGDRKKTLRGYYLADFSDAFDRYGQGGG